LAKALGVEGFEYLDTPSIFNEMAKVLPKLKGTTFNGIPATGLVLDLPPIGPEPFQGVNAQPNVLGRKF
jgi:hypothetical protein